MQYTFFFKCILPYPNWCNLYEIWGFLIGFSLKAENRERLFSFFMSKSLKIALSSTNMIIMMLIGICDDIFSQIESE